MGGKISGGLIKFSVPFFMLTMLNGCAALNTAKHSTFDCKDDNCPTPLEVYNETNSSPPEVAVGRNPKSWGAGRKNSREDAARNNASEYLRRSIDLTQSDPNVLVKTEENMRAKPIRHQSQVMRIWIAPWIDSQDNLHWNGYVYTEVSPRTWEIGTHEVRNAGVLRVETRK